MADTNKNKDINKRTKAQVAAGWEWFKEAAWLQVLLIVGVVVALVISIPYIVSAVQAAQNNDDSSFYTGHRISYSDLENYLGGKNKNVDGIVGDGTQTSSSYSSSKVGFVVMYYKDNDDTASTMQKYIDTAWDAINANTAINNGLRFYTINVGWYPDDKDKSSNYESLKDPSINYYNKYITLEQQMNVMSAYRSVYAAQDDDHKNSSLNEETDFDVDLLNNDTTGTMKTPMFALYTKSKDSSNYENATGNSMIEKAKPSKVVYSTLGSLSTSSTEDMMTQLYDLFDIQIYHN